MPIVIIIYSFLSNIFSLAGMGVYSESFAHLVALGSPALVTFLFYKLFVFRK